MAETMIERVARAIEIAIVEKTMHHPVSKLLPGLKWLWPIVARAAFAAMCNANDAMVDAGLDTVSYHGNDAEFNVGDCWRAMIDAAVVENAEGQQS